ncbi:MAG: RAD55 family ATPase [Thermoplasmatota archaeon]
MHDQRAQLVPPSAHATHRPDPGGRRIALKFATGVKRLDDLLGGGVPDGSFTLLYGPPFIGRDILSRLFLLQGLREGMPGCLVLTDATAASVREELKILDPRYQEYEDKGLIHFVDAFARSIGAEDAHKTTEFVDGAMNFNGIVLAVNNAQRKMIGEHANHRLVFDSVSTLITYNNAQTAFRFLQVLLGKSKLAGATGLLLMDRGMHSEPEVQAIKHLATGLIEVKNEQDRNMIRIEGIGVTENPGWVEYRFTPTEFDIVGSFTSGRIR